MTLITGTLQQAVPRQVPKKDGSGVWTFYDLTIDSKKYQTSQAVFNQSVGLVGSQVLVEVENEQRNGYDNWKVHSCTVAGSAAQAVTQGQQSQVMQTIVGAQQAQAGAAVRSQTEKDASICRQCAGKVAATLLQGSGVPLETFFDVARKVATWFETGVNPNEIQVVNALASEMGAVASDDDIPF